MTGRRRQFVETVLVQVARIGLGAVAGMVTARALHAQGRGAYAAVATIASTALALGHLSLEQGHMSLWRRQRDAIPANSALLGPLTGTVSAVAAAVVVLALGPHAVPLPGYGLLIVALAAVPFGMTVLYLNGVLVLQGRVDVVNRAALLSAVAQCGALAACGLAGRLSVAVVVWVWALSTALPLATLLPALGPRLRDANRVVAVRALAYGLRYHAAFAALYLLFRLDVLLLNGLSSPAAVGLYSVAITIGELAWIVTNAAAQVSLARQADAELPESASVTLAMTRLSVLLSAIAVAGMCVAAPVLIPLMYGSEFAGSVPALLGVAPGIFAFGATRPIWAYLVRLNRPIVTSGIVLAAMAGNVGLCLLLIPRWGVLGCALASSAGYIGLCGAQLVWFLRATGTPARRLAPGRAELGFVRRIRRHHAPRVASGPSRIREATRPGS
ncbi:MAG TPA: polysaccharide biosynthesis C-terminal domain-containing protein [Planosporangium sp.]|nr:polysaccharide biosynthesis C-terminal domain-containing protein [Planosporangium sp.]